VETMYPSNIEPRWHTAVGKGGVVIKKREKIAKRKERNLRQKTGQKNRSEARRGGRKGERHPAQLNKATGGLNIKQGGKTEGNGYGQKGVCRIVPRKIKRKKRKNPTVETRGYNAVDRKEKARRGW